MRKVMKSNHVFFSTSHRDFNRPTRFVNAYSCRFCFQFLGLFSKSNLTYSQIRSPVRKLAPKTAKLAGKSEIFLGSETSQLRGHLAMIRHRDG
jgi:hypothetical protein